MIGYDIANEVPPMADYLRLRRIAGLTARSEASAKVGLPNSCAAVTIRKDGAVVGMGRAVGDGALFFHIFDIAVDPAHQGKGLGKAVMAALMEQLKAIAPTEAHVSLIADGEAHRLYAQFEFEPVMPESIGMSLWLKPAKV